MKLVNLVNKLFEVISKCTYWNFMKVFGIGNTMRFSKRYNKWRKRDLDAYYQFAYDDRWEILLAENGYSDPKLKINQIEDGWALDTSNSLPHLKELLDESEEAIKERKGKATPYPGKEFFASLMEPNDIENFPSFKNFALSSELLATVGNYMKTVPVLSTTKPSGIRFVESNRAYDTKPGRPFRESQFYHLDIHDSPLVYVIVLLEDVTRKHGPWCFLPASVSKKAEQKLNYRKWRSPYRITDEKMYSVVDSKEMIELTYPKGTVLFIDSNRCFHYGSRNSELPRYMMMYGFTSLCRTDLTEQFIKKRFKIPTKPTDSELRRLVCQAGL